MAFRILVVEDDTATRRGMAQLLTGAGYEVTETASMTDALALLSTDTPDRPLITFDTVGIETPADSAMYAMVTGFDGSPPGCSPSADRPDPLSAKVTVPISLDSGPC